MQRMKRKKRIQANGRVKADGARSKPGGRLRFCEEHMSEEQRTVIARELFEVILTEDDGVGYYATAEFETTLEVDITDIKQHFPFVIWYAK